MKVLYFDTETSGLSAGAKYIDGEIRNGHICQLTYIILEDSKFYKAKNLYFTVDYIEKSAEYVHHLSVDLLKKYSQGKIFADLADEIYEDFADADLIVAHNFAFDHKFMSAEFERIGMSFDYKKCMCSMRAFTPILKLPSRNPRCYKNPSLKELADYYGIDDDFVISYVKNLFGSTASAHDARFDTVKLMFAVEFGRRIAQEITNRYFN